MVSKKLSGGLIALILVLTGCSQAEVENLPINDNPEDVVVEDVVIEEPSDDGVISADPTSLPQTVPGAPADTVDMVVEEAPVEVQTRVFKVEMKRYEFIPDLIEVNVGDTVVLDVTSSDVAHGLMINDYNVDIKAAANESAQIEFVADKAGTFDIRCSVYCGSGHPTMSAKLIVN